MKNSQLYLVVLVSALITSCSILEVYEDDEFTLLRTDFKGEQLRIDGYYYSIVENKDYHSLYVFYKNGLVFTPGVFEKTEDFHKIRDAGYLKRDWGLFIVEENIIRIEEYELSMLEGMPAYIGSGEILNDSTFVLKETKRSKDGSEYRQINEVYHFREFSPKPDSTNNFIK